MIGNASFVIPLRRIYEIVEQAKAKTSGLGKRVRLAMSHTSGKMMILPCPEDAAWFDDLPGNEQYWSKPSKK